MKVDIAIIGAGIAGATLAAELAPHCTVALVEAEDTPGYHSTGRSAAFWHETLGGPAIVPLTRASFAALDDGGFLRPRAALEVASAADVPLLAALEVSARASGVVVHAVDAAEICARVPRANPVLVAGLLEEKGGDIDVAALHADVLARFRRAGGILVIGSRVDAITAGRSVTAGTTTIACKVIVNAAGAWADAVAVLAGARPLGIEPRRRTMLQIRIDGDDIPDDLPLVIDVGGAWYFRPEGPSQLWLSPHDETPVVAHDVAPEEVDVARAVERFEAVTSWRVVAVERKWAGLRSFAPDRLPVFGFDAEIPGFFWCAGQGGVGIQTSPAAARLCAHLILGSTVSPPPAVDAASFSPLRFAQHAISS